LPEIKQISNTAALFLQISGNTTVVYNVSTSGT